MQYSKQHYQNYRIYTFREKFGGTRIITSSNTSNQHDGRRSFKLLSDHYLHSWSWYDLATRVPECSCLRQQMVTCASAFSIHEHFINISLRVAWLPILFNITSLWSRRELIYRSSTFLEMTQF